jgi:hypothetical protein
MSAAEFHAAQRYVEKLVGRGDYVSAAAAQKEVVWAAKRAGLKSIARAELRRLTELRRLARRRP